MLRHALACCFPELALRFCALERKAVGEAGERVAARWLRARGWRVLGRRVRTTAGELDLLVEARNARAVVEVKTGRLGSSHAAWELYVPWRPGRRLDHARLARLRRIARLVGATRVDLVEVVVVRGRLRVLHHRDLRRPLGTDTLAGR